MRSSLICAAVSAIAIAGPVGAQPAPDPELRAILAQAVTSADSFEDRFDAEVWLLDMSQLLEPRVPDAAERVELLKLIHREATRVDLPPELVLAVIDIESGFDRYAVSRAGAQGLMQIMSFWLDELDTEHANLFDPALNLRMGCTILRVYLDREQGNLPGALARYNGSHGRRTYPDKVLSALSAKWYRE